MEKPTTKHWLTRGRAIFLVLSCGIIVCFAIAAVSIIRAGSVIPGYSDVRTDEDRLNFIRSFGWEVDENYTQSQVTIPNEFDQVYENYNQLQIEQGFDLRQIAGRVVDLYTYNVLNHPSGEDGVVLNLLMYKDKVVGGDVMSPRLDGFMHSLEIPPEM